VNQREFASMISRFPNLSEKELALLNTVLVAAPYCQSARILKAKALKNSGSTQSTIALQTAAVYCQDRALLKRWMESTSVINTGSETIKPTNAIEAGHVAQPNATVVDVNQVTAVQEKAIVTDAVKKVTATESQSPSDTSAPADQVMKDLGELKQRKERFRELTFNLSEPEKVKEVEKVSKKQPRIFSEEAIGEQVIQEIKTSRKKIKPDSQKQSEQLEIIDKFIKAKLTVIKPANAPIKSDFTEPAGGYSENVISETLVDILERQGKKEKAVEVLKKLIWKFPQKKALFAARIEKLS